MLDAGGAQARDLAEDKGMIRATRYLTKARGFFCRAPMRAQRSDMVVAQRVVDELDRGVRGRASVDVAARPGGYRLPATG